MIMTLSNTVGIRPRHKRPYLTSEDHEQTVHSNILIMSDTIRDLSITQENSVDCNLISPVDSLVWVKAARIITKTRLYNFDPLKPHFYIVKLGFTGVYIIFLISAQKHRLWVLVRTASARRF